LPPQQRERRVAPLLHIFAEILDQLFAPLAGIEAAAVEHDWTVQAVAPPEHRAAREQMRRKLTRLRFLVGRSAVACGWRTVVVRGTLRHPRIGLLLRQVDADADDFLEQRPLHETRPDELPLALGEITERGRVPGNVP